MTQNTKKICLFTAHSPLIGGGAAIIRSIIPNLENISIEWKYTGRNKVKGWESGYLCKGIMGDLPLLRDIFLTWKMLSNRRTKEIDNIVTKLISIDCDGYWIISHNEGLRIAYELTKIQSKPVHLTVHDDWAGALCARSSRYFFFSKLANTLTIDTLKSINSVDVISEGMKLYYKKISGVDAAICHRYIPNSLIPNNIKKSSENSGSANVLIVGHIGSIYSYKELFNFLTISDEYFKSIGKKFIFKSWGCNIKIKNIPKHLRGLWQNYKSDLEENIINELRTCDMVYCMYPFDNRQSIFVQTSLPTKLSTYVQVGKPILGHGPASCTLKTFLEETQTGKIWISNTKEELFNIYTCLLNSKENKYIWKNAAKKYFGLDNIENLKHVLIK